LGSETGFPLWVEEKARIRAFFLSRSALSLFFALFFLHAFALAGTHLCLFAKLGNRSVKRFIASLL
jgi:hypothetical protein